MHENNTNERMLPVHINEHTIKKGRAVGLCNVYKTAGIIIHLRSVAVGKMSRRLALFLANHDFFLGLREPHSLENLLGEETTHRLPEFRRAQPPRGQRSPNHHHP